ncbi:uncharacterized protein KGF55_000522 [Candida pseudojiufengensis]|uniref:uncharacterized protein n=1 Tax=Candida pseudojiufengensis TaxID=497109 RepID=UPI002224A8CE|nr:uncharacterized protein KGF55_000522 [Candida pseudojiufengensis]KAI5966213.1 hypothetical protein KGF55_000522 [Candida pseudojiufengensis]
MTDDSEKYPPNIQQLFQPKPPFKYVQPIDYPPEKRSTTSITPISNFKSQITSYITKTLPKKEAKIKKQPLTKHQQNLQDALIKRQKQKESFERQLKDWNDPELFAKHEQEVMKDPYKTVFIARLDYDLNEIDISQYFQKFGVIESISIIKDREGKSRGYGFVVYERDTDAQTCVSTLSRRGVKLKERTILVDIERSRVWRNWKPRRLGGGEGGRNYQREGKVASVAAGGRRLHIANNSSHQKDLFQQQQTQPHHIPRGPTSHNVHNNGYSHHHSNNAPHNNLEEGKVSIKDKYARYSSPSEQQPSYAPAYQPASNSRSIRSIRQRD